MNQFGGLLISNPQKSSQNFKK